MNAGTRCLVDLSAALGAGRTREVRDALARALAESEPRDVEEALLQAYLFVGFPSVLQAMEVWRSLGAEPAEEPSQETEGGRALWRDRGRRLCRRVYGAAYEKLRAKVRSLHPALDRWMVEEGYGKVLARPALDAKRRELCIVALLAAAGHGPQLHSHLRGALHVGASEADVDAALRAGTERARSSAARRTATRIWEAVRCRS